MKESDFIEHNLDKWRNYESLIEDNVHSDAEEVYQAIIETADDLSYARTFYANRAIKSYLNGLLQRIAAKAFVPRRTFFRSIFDFFLEDLPFAVYQSRQSFLWALILFLLSFIIGYFSSAMDEHFARTMLGDSYIRMTEENIKSGDPLAVYKSGGHAEMTFFIMFNNIVVCFRYFLAGIFGGIGSVALMILEGVRLGSFLQFFARFKLLSEANLTVWMHGALEISAMIIGCAAGMTLGKGLIFPGTLTRLQAFQMSAKQGTKIFIGTIPMLIIAALIEGNLTRETKIGDNFRAFFIFFWLFCIVAYFVWYPFYKNKKGFKTKSFLEKIPYDKPRQIQITVLKSTGDIIGDTFSLLRQGRAFIIRVSSLLATVFCFFVFAFSKKEPNETIDLNAPFFQHWLIIGQFFTNENVPFLFFITALTLSVLHLFLFRFYFRSTHPNVSIKNQFSWSHIFLTVILQLLLLWLIEITSTMLFVYFLVLPYILMWQYSFWQTSDIHVFESRQNILARLRQCFGYVYSTYFLLLLLAYFLFTLTDSLFTDLYIWLIGWNLSFLNENLHNQAATVITTWVSVFAFYILYAANILGLISVYYVTGEITEAIGLKERVATIQKLKNIRGIVKE